MFIPCQVLQILTADSCGSKYLQDLEASQHMLQQNRVMPVRATIQSEVVLKEIEVSEPH